MLLLHNLRKKISTFMTATARTSKWAIISKKLSSELSLFLGSKIWKIIPQDIITLESLNIFKKRKEKLESK